MPTSITVAPGLTQSPLTIMRLADGGDQDIGAARQRGQIAGLGMGHGDGGVGRQQKLRRGLAEQQRAADHQRVQPGDLAQRFLEQDHHARRRAGDQLGAAAEQQARIGGRQRVHVLGGIERVEHRLLADLPRQRQLHEYSVYGFVGVEGADHGQNLRLARRSPADGDAPI